MDNFFEKMSNNNAAAPVTSSSDDTFGCVRKRTAPMRVGIKRAAPPSVAAAANSPSPIIRRIIEILPRPLMKTKRAATVLPKRTKRTTIDDKRNVPDNNNNIVLEAGAVSTCICKRHNGDDWIGCNGKTCKDVWFHLGCVGLCEDDLADMERFYCERCRKL